MPARRARAAALVTAVALTASTLGACARAGTTGRSAARLTVVAFSMAKPAVDALGAAFARTPEGRGVRLDGSYGGSGAQTRAVLAGQPADLVLLSLAPDVDRLAGAGLVGAGWDTVPGGGSLADSVVVLAVRPGNPKHIRGWSDVIRPGIGVVTADPGTSGAARWNLLAAYAQALGPDHDPAAAREYLGRFVDRVVSWNDSGRSATDAFTRGSGDVLVSTENEAIAARAAGIALDYVVPRTTLLVENPATVTTTAAPEAARFLRFAHSAAGRRILAAQGFRPRDPVAQATAAQATPVRGAADPDHPFPAVPRLLTVADAGGWPAAGANLFDQRTGLLPALRRR